MILLQIYSLLILSLLVISSINTDNKDNKIGAFLLAPVIAYIINTIIN